MSLVRNIARSYRAPRDVARGLLAGGVREDRALMFLMLGCMLAFVAQWPGLARGAALDPDITFQQRMGGALFAVLFLVPLLMYGLAGLIQLALRLVGFAVPGHAVRMVLFWAFLATTPLMLMQGGLSAFTGQGIMAQAIGFVVGAAFLYILASGLRAAHEAARAGALD